MHNNYTCVVPTLWCLGYSNVKTPSLKCFRPQKLRRREEELDALPSPPTPQEVVLHGGHYPEGLVIARGLSIAA
jgi:hypothetical protein